MKIKSGIIMPNPEDPTKCIITSLDKMKLKYVPNFALKSMLKKELLGKMQGMVNKFKSSAAYAELGLEESKE